jgi:glutamate synthase (ferredoxin)
MRLLAHNGEINTLQGNLEWMSAREPELAHPLWGERIRDLLPPVHADSSDSGALDKLLELLVRSGRGPLETVMMCMPEAYENRPRRGEDAAVVDFYDYYSGVLEAWDGPALVAFSDGCVVGAAVDRNGLRPARFERTRSGLVLLASEAGAAGLLAEDIVERGRLGPGEMLAVDLETGELLRNARIKPEVAAARPYGAWLSRHRRDGAEARAGAAEQACGEALAARPSDDVPTLLRRQTAAGFTAEDVDMILLPMAQRAREPRFSMGNDAPLPILSSKPHTLYDYFAERFAQVTNPPIDPLRERLVMSLAMRLGARGDLLTAGPGHARQLELPSPILDEAGLRSLCDSDLRVAQVSTAYDVTSGPWGLREAVDRVTADAVATVLDGAEILVLSDRPGTLAPEASHVPPLLAVGAVHRRLLREGLRCRASLVVDAAQCWSVHHFACLIGYGASAVSPHLAFETVRHLCAEGCLSAAASAAPLSEADAERNYRVSAERGLFKILSKMGISRLSSYHGAQLFEAMGIGPDLLDMGFCGTPSRIGGLSVEELAQETVWIHQQAFPELSIEKLHNFGFVRFRRGGEYHLNNPEVAKTLRRACVDGSAELYATYGELLSGRPCTVLRDLVLPCSDRAPLPLEEVEPAADILRRFCTGGMSLGALSAEAHQVLAIAMNRIGGKSNSGEGGEDPDRALPLEHVGAGGVSTRYPGLRGLRRGDVAASRIKQVASGRFGVTPAYLAAAEQLEIKIAQGAKPGEGGELPGEKVTDAIAELRHAQPGRTLISPPPHHDIYSIEDLAQLVFDLRQINPAASIAVKLVSGWGVGTIAAGVAKADADVITVSGHGGGTAAASLNSIKHAGIPWELGLADAHRTLAASGLRERVRLRVDGDLRTGRDVVLAAVLGADEYAFGTAALMAEGCVMARVCHTDRCPVGIATQREELRARFAGEPQHVVNYFTFVAEEVRAHLARLGYRTLADIVGRADLLLSAEVELPKTAGLDVAWMRTPATRPEDGARLSPATRATAEPGLDERLLADPEVAAAIADHGEVTRRAAVANRDRALGARLAGAIARAHEREPFRGHIRLELRGAAGQSLGAFIPDGVTLDLCGEANDYVGKGMAGGTVVLRPSTAGLEAANQVIAGNTCLYGATGGALFADGRVGERFAVRNSGARAVVAGAGDHCCEYMTGGVVVVLGDVGRNACAGMTGGTAYLCDIGGLAASLNMDTVSAAPVSLDDEVLRGLLRAHLELTGSAGAQAILAGRLPLPARFVKVQARAF